MTDNCPYCGRFLREDKIDEGTEDEEIIGLVCTSCMKLYAQPDYDNEQWWEYDLNFKNGGS